MLELTPKLFQETTDMIALACTSVYMYAADQKLGQPHDKSGLSDNHMWDK